ncbi:E3 ubiquitin-protein ligase RZFP34-like [Tasmannia lanceolata]|uniref:E3 ubiquitin-protein ligase RZFP34-like n=1 Tax=Tasmannia lanceolata TaxID=3420 RepID=UPI00406421EB
MHHNCPVCFEYLFDSTKDISVLRCGHTLHLDCMKEMELHFQYACPVCSRSFCDMSMLWEKLDQEVASTPMPEMYQHKMVWILCNDCGSQSEVHFHFIAHKCLSCNSYNTRQTRGSPASCSSSI